MNSVMFVDNSPGAKERYMDALSEEHVSIQVCSSVYEAFEYINETNFDIVFVLWDISGPPFAPDLLRACNRKSPKIPVVVMTGALNASLASRAHHIGASDYLFHPVDKVTLWNFIQHMLGPPIIKAPVLDLMREKIKGNSPQLLTVLNEVARISAQDDLRVLLHGETGTGKELVAQAIYSYSSCASRPLVAANISQTERGLVASALFGHEKGAFTGATSRRKGWLEMAGNGILFLDEIGDLDKETQVKLLRAIQEREFQRLGGSELIPFQARLISATNHDLDVEVVEGRYRADFYHRIAEVTIHLPPLREREGDIEVLLNEFLTTYSKDQEATFSISQEARAIILSYAYPGNVRELINIIKAAITLSDDNIIRPTDLPLKRIYAFQNAYDFPEDAIVIPESESAIGEIKWPEDWLKMKYDEAKKHILHAFNRIYLKQLFEQANQNLTRAADRAGIDRKTFRKQWHECGLPNRKFSKGENNE